MAEENKPEVDCWGVPIKKEASTPAPVEQPKSAYVPPVMVPRPRGGNATQPRATTTRGAPRAPASGPTSTAGGRARGTAPPPPPRNVGPRKNPGGTKEASAKIAAERGDPILGPATKPSAMPRGP